MKRNFSFCACHLGPKLPVLFVWSNRVLKQEADTQPVVSWLWRAYKSSDPWFFLYPSLLSTLLSKSLSLSAFPISFPCAFSSFAISLSVESVLTAWSSWWDTGILVSYLRQRKHEWLVYSNFRWGLLQSLNLTAFKNYEESS